MSEARNTDLLKGVATLFNFPGSQGAPGEVDAAAPVTLVHDVGPGARGLGSIIVQTDFTVTTAGGGVAGFSTRDLDSVYESSTDLLALLRSLGYTQRNTDCWLIGFQASTNGTNFTSCTAAMRQVSDRRRVFNTNQSTEAHVFFIGDNPVAASVYASGGEQMIRFSSTVPWGMVQLPLLMGELLVRTLDDGVGATTVRYKPIFCIVPAGADPIRWGGLNR